jgi:outer membrane protein OmpA-like peptidoglycan-associated protein
MKGLKRTSVIVALLILCAQYGLAQQNPTQIQVQKSGDNPIYKITINVVERTTKAINYRVRSGATKIDFRGTPLLPEARGEAKVESKQGYIEIEVEFDDLQPATRFGPEFLTYVMWAISPEGRASNLGEVILNGTKSKLDVTSELQAFGLIVTAEPYFAVTQPSDVVVMENFVRKDTVGKIDEIDAKFELLKRGQYTVNVPPADLKPIPLDKDTPLDLYEAQNAIRIARWAGADKDAPDSYAKAAASLKQAEAYKARKAGTKPISMAAREAAQTAEDARLIALKRQEENRLAAERAASADREAQAKAAAAASAAAAAASAAAADRARLETEDAQRRKLQAEQEQRLEAERRARADADRARAEAERAAADAQRVAAEATAQRERLEAERAGRERQEAEAKADQARNAADQARNAAEQAQRAVEQAEREKLELRAQLVRQLNLILETRDTARGLIVNMSDVLFDTGQFTLRPGAREKLAKISGIILAHPGLSMQVEGHTDSVGSDELNMRLSEKRAFAVRDYLTAQGINSASITARGFGKTQPVVSNDTAAGRQQNRRVEMIVAGEVIGTSISVKSSSR